MAIAAFLVLVVALIVIGVKLHHRNLELDDLYDEYNDFEEFDDDDFDDFGEEEDFEEEYDEVDYEEDYGYDNDGDESEELIDDLDELLSSQPSKKRGHMEEDDTFKVDFIDLD